MGSSPRDYDSPEYKKWRDAVYKRDKYKCQMPGCTRKKASLNAHHIQRWAEFPELRFVVSNGITLCRTCHRSIWGRENEYETTFRNIINSKSADAISVLLMLHKKG